MREAAQWARIGDYDLTRELPPSMPSVLEFAATHVVLPRQARLRIGSDAISAKRLMREACILEALRHPGVPRVFECGLLEDRRPWIATELIDGPTLADAIADRPLLVKETLALLRDLAQILHHAHARGIAHGQLRPQLVVRDTTGLYIESWADARTHDGGEFDPRADIHALGAIAYAALTNAAPAMPLARRLPALPRTIALLVDRMLSDTPLARPSAAEVRAEAIQILGILETPPPDDIDSAIVEEIELELTQDLSRERPLRWTPPYQPARNTGAVIDPLSARRR